MLDLFSKIFPSFSSFPLPSRFTSFERDRLFYSYSRYPANSPCACASPGKKCGPDATCGRVRIHSNCLTSRRRISAPRISPRPSVRDTRISRYTFDQGVGQSHIGSSRLRCQLVANWKNQTTILRLACMTHLMSTGGNKFVDTVVVVIEEELRFEY